MIRTEFYAERKDSVKLYRTYSDKYVMLRKEGTEEIYSEAIDVENIGFGYVETEIPIEGGELTVEDTLAMLRDLGVDTNDNKG